MIKIIITGADGFVGSYLVNYFKKKNISIFAVGKKFGNLEEKKNWDKIPKAKFLIHCAHKTKKRKNSNKKYLLSSLSMTRHAINFCIKNNSHLIFPSTFVYGKNKAKIYKENMKCKPANIYTLSKYLSENMLKIFSKTHELKVTILRLFNVYGLNQNKEFLIPKIFLSLKRKIYLNSFNFSRDYIHISDVARAFERCLFYKKKKFEIFNIGSGKSYSIRFLIKMITKISRTKLNIYSKNIKIAGEVRNTRANIQKAKNNLKWNPKTSIEKGLKNYYYS